MGFYLRDLYLLTQDDMTTLFHACTDLADDLINHCTNLENNLLLLSEQLRSQEALGNRLIKKMGFENDMSVLINSFMKENPHLVQELKNQFVEASEDFRVLFKSGVPRIAVMGKERPRRIPKCRYVPWLGQPEVEQYSNVR